MVDNPGHLPAKYAMPIEANSIAINAALVLFLFKHIFTSSFVPHRMPNGAVELGRWYPYGCRIASNLLYVSDFLWD
jgi:hypothetical protein